MIVITAIWANIGIIPSSTNAPVIYDHIFQFIAPLSIFFLLLDCDLKAIQNAGRPLLFLFLLGSIATFAGVIFGSWITSTDLIGDDFPVLAGMFTGTYTGGSINFNAVAMEYDIIENGNLYTGAIAIDNIWTALWMILTIALPKFLGAKFPRKSEHFHTQRASATDNDHEIINVQGLAILLSIGILALVISEELASYAKKSGVQIPSIIILTTFSLLLAQLSFMKKIRGGRTMGLFGLYLFLAVIGAFCDFSAFIQMGSLGLALFIFVSVIIIVHGLIIFGIGALFRQDWEIIALASQANVGGSGSALALSKSFNRPDLFLPAILMGTLGNALGTYLGFLMVALMG